MSGDRGRTKSDQSRGRRAFTLGNILIVLGIALVGSALSIAATRAALPPDQAAGAAVSSTPPVPAATTATTPYRAPALQRPPATTTLTSTPVPIQSAGSSAAPASPTATPTSEAIEPTPTPVSDLPHATHITIPAVGIDTEIVEVGYKTTVIDGQPVIEWDVAEYAAGHHSLSADPGEGGNIVVTGHDDWKGEVFRTLEHVELGDEVTLTTPNGEYRYVVAEIYFRKDVGVPLSERLATGMFLAPMDEERLTLVTCWPYGIDDHRLIVVAKPAP